MTHASPPSFHHSHYSSHRWKTLPTARVTSTLFEVLKLDSVSSPHLSSIYTLWQRGPMSHASWWGSHPRGGTDSWCVVGSWLEGCRRRKSSLCYFLLIHSSRTGVSSSVSVSLCSILQIRQMTSHRPSSYQHWNNDTCTPAHLHTSTPASLLSPPNLGSLSAAVYLSGRDFSILQPETLTYESLGSPQKTNKSLCLSLHINPSPPVFSKCLFNENCCISSLSEYLMAPVSLQVPERGRDIWHRKAEPRTHIYVHACTHTLHAHKHFTFQPRWVSGESRSACN